MARREHYPYKIRVSDAPRIDKKFTDEVRNTVSQSLAASAVDTLMTDAQPAMNPTVKIWGTPEHVYFDMTVDKPDDSNEANEWRLRFSAPRFAMEIRDAVLTTMTEMESGTFEREHHIQ